MTFDKCEFEFRRWAATDPKSCTIARGWDAAWENRQALIDAHNARMDAECAVHPAYAGCHVKGFTCDVCPRRHKIED